MTNAQPASHSALVVEDDDHIGYLLKFMLERESYHVDLMQDGRMATQFIESRSTAPNLVLLDVMLPYVDGFELVEIVRRQKGWETVPIVMLTAKTQEHDIVRALDAGANDYIVKPFQLNELLARLRRFVPTK